MCVCRDKDNDCMGESGAYPRVCRHHLVQVESGNCVSAPAEKLRVADSVLEMAGRYPVVASNELQGNSTLYFAAWSKSINI